jgi:hypothetical protein
LLAVNRFDGTANNPSRPLRFTTCGERPSCGWPSLAWCVPQIAAVTVHSLKDIEAILDAHYLGRDIQLAEAALLKLEARTKL